MIVDFIIGMPASELALATARIDLGMESKVEAEEEAEAGLLAELGLLES